MLIRIRFTVRATSDNGPSALALAADASGLAKELGFAQNIVSDVIDGALTLQGDWIQADDVDLNRLEYIHDMSGVRNLTLTFA